MSRPLIILCGKAQSGKTTSSLILKELIDNSYPSNSGVKIFSFATKLKEIAKELFDWNGKDKGLYYEETKDSGAVDIHYDSQTSAIANLPIRNKGRQLLINIGQQMRWIQEDVWTQYLKKQIELFLKSELGILDTVAIIDDCRFRNEIEIMKTVPNSISIHITRPEQLQINDISELDLDGYSGYDYVIANNGSLDDLKTKLNYIVEKHGLKRPGNIIYDTNTQNLPSYTN